jgi:hypothetical protein
VGVELRLKRELARLKSLKLGANLGALELCVMSCGFGLMQLSGEDTLTRHRFFATAPDASWEGLQLFTHLKEVSSERRFVRIASSHQVRLAGRMLCSKLSLAGRLLLLKFGFSRCTLPRLLGKAFDQAPFAIEGLLETGLRIDSRFGETLVGCLAELLQAAVGVRLEGLRLS